MFFGGKLARGLMGRYFNKNKGAQGNLPSKEMQQFMRDNQPQRPMPQRPMPPMPPMPPDAFGPMIPRQPMPLPPGRTFMPPQGPTAPMERGPGMAAPPGMAPQGQMSPLQMLQMQQQGGMNQNPYG
jgi:hypothetical protein